MFTLQDKGIPIFVWLDSPEDLENECRQQAVNLSRLPFAYHHIALMPDTHTGFGMPIGGVLAAEGVIVPNAVGVDIGCGVAYTATDWDADQVKAGMLKRLTDALMQRIPTGFSRYKNPQQSHVLDEFDPGSVSQRSLLPEIQEGYFQIGTLGGGNHFIELQAGDDRKLHIMVHSGSRNFGFKVAQHFNRLAKKLAKTKYQGVPAQYDLAYLAAESEEGTEYIRWMQLALRFAKENREKMMAMVCDEVTRILPRIQYSDSMDVHHNYAAKEIHYGKEVWVHRKGAIRAGSGDGGIIPGAMGANSYIVKGLGSKESFCSSPHGAGRQMGRKEAVRTIPAEKTLNDLLQRGVILGKKKMNDVSEESRFAYKNVDEVISQASDLVVPVRILSTLAVIKG